MAPQSPEEEKYDLINLKTRVLEDAGTSMPDFEKVYCIPEGDDWEFENVLGRFSRADYDWRVEHGVAALRTQSPAEVLGCDPRVLSQYYERRLLGVDAHGRLCLYQGYKNMLARAQKHVPLEKVTRFHIWEQERAAAIIDELVRTRRRRGGRGPPIQPKMAVMLDVSDMTISRHVNSDFLYVVKTLANYDQNHFPERMGTTFIMNAPSVFGMVWRIAKPGAGTGVVRGQAVARAHTVKKIHIVTDKEDWRTIVAAKLGDPIMQNLADEVQLDEAVNDPADDLNHSVKDVAAALLERLGGAEEVKEEDDAPPSTPKGQIRPSYADSSFVTVERGDDDSDDDHFLDARSPKLTSKEAKKELLLLDSLASGRSAGDLAKALQRLVVVQMGATIALCCPGQQRVIQRRFNVLPEPARAAGHEHRLGPHVPAVGLLLAAMTVPFGAIGYSGAEPGVLSVHLACMSALSGAFLILAVASLEVAVGASDGYFFSRAARPLVLRGGDDERRRHPLVLRPLTTAAYFCVAFAVAVVTLLSIGAKATRGGRERTSVTAKATGLLLLLATFDALIASTLLVSVRAAQTLLIARELMAAEKMMARRGRPRSSSAEKKRPNSPLRAALRLVASPSLMSDADDVIPDDADEEAVATARFEDEDEDDLEQVPLTDYERGAICWALFTGLVHIFMDGTFAIFSHLVRFTNDRGRLQRPWFVELWHLWGKVDARYRRSDSFIVVQDCAPRDDFLFFWVLFILTSIIRFLLPLPVLAGSIKGMLRDAEFHRRWHLQYRKLSTSERKRALEMEPALDDPL
ncbi:cholestenol delta-isomerase [Aureococcus anophagefferens]|nr:cholestenol delta-isomerase [Aureococcus anophagefferens]